VEAKERANIQISVKRIGGIFYQWQNKSTTELSLM